jgi:transposase-like protein
VLLAADGLTGAQIAERAGCTEPTVIKWRRQYAEAGLAGLEDERTIPPEHRGRAGPALRAPRKGLHSRAGIDYCFSVAGF